MSETIELRGLLFEVRRSSRRQTIGLTVDRRGELVIHAPEKAESRELTQWAGKKLLWVHRKLALKRNISPTNREPEFVSGESFSYLGHRYRLKLVGDQEEPLRLDQGRFCLRRDQCAEAPAHFRCWYVSTGSEWLKNRVRLYLHRTGTEPSGIQVRDLGFRWGSCGKKGLLFFNWRLLQLPVRLLDYVIVHELVHLKVPHHTAEFWYALELALPDWRQRQQALQLEARDFVVFGMNVEPERNRE